MRAYILINNWGGRKEISILASYHEIEKASVRVSSIRSLKYSLLTDLREGARITIATLKHSGHNFCEVDKPAGADYSGEGEKAHYSKLYS